MNKCQVFVPKGITKYIRGEQRRARRRKSTTSWFEQIKAPFLKDYFSVRLSVGQSLDKVCVLRAKPKWSPKVPSKSFPLIWVTIGLLIESLRHSFINDSGFYRHTQKDWTKVTLSARQTPFFLHCSGDRSGAQKTFLVQRWLLYSALLWNFPSVRWRSSSQTFISPNIYYALLNSFHKIKILRVFSLRILVDSTLLEPYCCCKDPVTEVLPM